MKVDEVCSCGAGLTIDEVQGTLAGVMGHVTAWRREHQHVEPAARRLVSAIGFQQYRSEEDEDDDSDWGGV